MTVWAAKGAHGRATEGGEQGDTAGIPAGIAVGVLGLEEKGGPLTTVGSRRPAWGGTRWRLGDGRLSKLENLRDSVHNSCGECCRSWQSSLELVESQKMRWEVVGLTAIFCPFSWTTRAKRSMVKNAGIHHFSGTLRAIDMNLTGVGHFSGDRPGGVT
jgi:hypothetical protein